MVFFEEKYGQIHYDEKTKIVKLLYNGYMTSEQLRIYYGKFLDCCVKNNAYKALHDTRKFFTVKSDDQEWISTVWEPRLMSYFSKFRVAILEPDNLVQKQAAVATNSKVTLKSNKSVFNFFAKESDAIAWLITQ